MCSHVSRPEGTLDSASPEVRTASNTEKRYGSDGVCGPYRCHHLHGFCGDVRLPFDRLSRRRHLVLSFVRSQHGQHTFSDVCFRCPRLDTRARPASSAERTTNRWDIEGRGGGGGYTQFKTPCPEMARNSSDVDCVPSKSDSNVCPSIPFGDSSSFLFYKEPERV